MLHPSTLQSLNAPESELQQGFTLAAKSWRELAYTEYVRGNHAASSWALQQAIWNEAEAMREEKRDFTECL